MIETRRTRRVPEEDIQRAIEESFQCHRCGACCKGSGVVRVSPPEADRMAAHLGLTRRRFLRQYALRTSSGEYFLRDIENAEQWCVFLTRDDAGNYGCRVHEAKPDQCGSFPEKWRNDDSLESCAGLRAMMRVLRRGLDAAEEAPPSPAAGTP